MITISRSQVQKLDKVPRDIYLKKVKEYVSVELGDHCPTDENLKKRIEVAYAVAFKSGLRTEKEIAKFILDSVSQTL